MWKYLVESKGAKIAFGVLQQKHLPIGLHHSGHLLQSLQGMLEDTQGICRDHTVEGIVLKWKALHISCEETPLSLLVTFEWN